MNNYLNPSDRGHRLAATRNAACQTIDVYATHTDILGDVIAFEGEPTGSVNVERVRPGEAYRPFARLNEERAQQLMDDLWRAGLRPTEGKASAGLAAAQESHLNHLAAILDRVLPSALRQPENDVRLGGVLRD